MFHMFNMVEFLMSSFVACSFFVLINPLITLWLGDGYTVGVGYVFIFFIKSICDVEPSVYHILQNCIWKIRRRIEIIYLPAQF